MSIATKLAALTQIRTDIRTALAGKGISASTHDFADFAQDIDSIQTGGGARLPAEYQEVEWVGSSGTQRIETGIYNDTANVPIQYDIMGVNFADVTTRQEAVGSQGQHYIGVVSGRWQTSQGQSYNSNAIANADTWYEVKMYLSGVSSTAGNGKFYARVSDTDFEAWRSKASGSSDSIGFTVNADYQVCLFALNGQNIPASCKLKEVIIYQNDIKVRDLVPCYRIADTEIGYYDLVNDVFYTNAGTGTFTKGADV